MYILYIRYHTRGQCVCVAWCSICICVCVCVCVFVVCVCVYARVCVSPIHYSQSERITVYKYTESVCVQSE